MALLLFDFCPNSQVPETLAPESPTGMSLNGWEFSMRPSVPYRRKFRVMLHGLRWQLNTNGLYNSTTTPTINARRLELFYAEHQRWKAFGWTHPHLGLMEVKFAEVLNVPAGTGNGSGWIEPLEVVFIENNPGF